MNWVYAINERRLVAFTYEGLPRVIIPAAYGVNHSTGNELVRGYQVEGRDATRSVPAWSLFRIDKMSGAHALERRFGANPPDYQRGDKAMDVIRAQL
jgi:hypothetical protein